MNQTNEQRPFDYVAEAHLTASPHFYGEKVNLMLFRVALTAAVEALNDLDAIKKTLFYDKELPSSLSIKGGETCEKLPLFFKNDEFGKNVIHAIIGTATEAGELLAALRSTTIEIKEFDEVNSCEEAGDIFWYLAILSKNCGLTFDGIQRTNIAKLRHRFPDRFTKYDANNRDLSGERRILEGEGVEQTSLFEQALDRLEDVLKGDDGQAYKEGEKFLRKHREKVSS